MADIGAGFGSAGLLEGCAAEASLAAVVVGAAAEGLG